MANDGPKISYELDWQPTEGNSDRRPYRVQPLITHAPGVPAVLTHSQTFRSSFSSPTSPARSYCGSDGQSDMVWDIADIPGHRGEWPLLAKTDIHTVNRNLTRRI